VHTLRRGVTRQTQEINARPKGLSQRSRKLMNLLTRKIAVGLVSRVYLLTSSGSLGVAV